MIYDVIRWEEKSIVEAARKRGVDLKLFDARELILDLDQNYGAQFGNVTLQRCVSYYRSIHTTAALEFKGVQVVNDLGTATTCGNKLLTSLILVNNKIPTPHTMLSFNPETSLKALDKLGYPAILKPTVGSWGKLIAILKDRESAESIFEDRESMYPLYQVHYIQEKVERPPRDIRSVVVGDEVIAAIYRNSSAGWRTNTSRGANTENCPITNELETLCLKAASAVGKGVFGVDLMETPEGLVVHEVNTTTEFKNTVPVTGVDIPGAIVEYLLSLAK